MSQDAHFSGSHSEGRSAKRRRTLSLTKDLKSGALPTYFKTQHEKYILNALEVIKTDVKLGRAIRWNVLLPVVRAMRVNDETAPDCLKFVTELLNLFERYQCKDASVILEVLLVMIFLTAHKLHLMKRSKFNKICKFIYKPYGTDIDLVQGLDLVYNTVRCGNLGLLKLQLKFGMGIMTPFFTKDTCFDYLEFLTRAWPNQRIYPFNYIVPDERIFKKICSVFKPETRRRRCIVLRVLEMVRTMHKYNQELREHFAECYRLLFESIPEAYVTTVEVKAFLEEHLPDAYSILIHEITEAFERLLPKLAEVPQPRSLKHLCRIQVRDSLRQNLNLPHGVSLLLLPIELKEYIKLHDDGDYSTIVKTTVAEYDWEGDRFWPKSVIKIPERDDFVTSFLKNL